MPCISASIIKHPRRDRVCPICYEHIKGETARLYGNAEQGDPLYVLYLHPACVTGKESLRKLQAAQHRVQGDKCPSCGGCGIDPLAQGDWVVCDTCGGTGTCA